MLADVLHATLGYCLTRYVHPNSRRTTTCKKSHEKAATADKPRKIGIVVRERVQRILDNHMKLDRLTLDRSEEAYTAFGLSGEVCSRVSV